MINEPLSKMINEREKLINGLSVLKLQLIGQKRGNQLK